MRRFILALGLPIKTEVALRGNVPDVRVVELAEAACISTALEHRLDLKTTRDGCEDAKRRLRVTRSALLPELDAFGEGTLSDDNAESSGGADFEESFSAGLTLKVPLDRRDERDAVREAQLDVAAAVRQLREKEDEVRLEIMENFGKLQFLAATLDIERRNITVAERRARNAFLRFKNGELLNRDVVEAENELLEARNSYAQALVSCEMQRIRLMRNVGALDVSADGLLTELPLAGAR